MKKTYRVSFRASFTVEANNISDLLLQAYYANPLRFDDGVAIEPSSIRFVESFSPFTKSDPPQEEKPDSPVSF